MMTKRHGSYRVKVEEGKQYRFGTMVLTGISTAGGTPASASRPIPSGESFDKNKYEEFLTNLEMHPEKSLAICRCTMKNVGHWVENGAGLGVADVLSISMKMSLTSWFSHLTFKLCGILSF